MGVFICWSGDRSKTIALALQKLLESVLAPRPRVFISEDIDKGAEWFQAVRTSLNSSMAGIVVLTHENIHSPWMHFEAGAIARTLEADPAIEPHVNGPVAEVAGRGAEGPVVMNPAGAAATSPAAGVPLELPARKAIFPLLHGVSAGAISGPLSAYQSTSTTQADMGRLLSALAGILKCQLLEHTDREWLIPEPQWSTFEQSLKAAIAPLAKVIPDFDGLFRRKTFEEAFHQCTSQDWLGRYEAARSTQRRLNEHEDLVKSACSGHEQGMFWMLLTDLDVYAMAIEALLIAPKNFDLNASGELTMDSGIRTCCENQRLAIKSVSMRLLHPLDPPLTTAAVRFMAAATPEERRAIIHRIEGRIRWHREIAYEAPVEGRAEAACEAITHLMNETTKAGDRSSAAASLLEPEAPLQCSVPGRLRSFRASSWDLDRIFYYRLVYYFETAAFRWPQVASPDLPKAGAAAPDLAVPMEHDLFCAARDVEIECERYRARTKGGSLMPLTYALDALQGLHPNEHKTTIVERAVTSAIDVVETEMGLLEAEKTSDIRRLLAKLR